MNNLVSKIKYYLFPRTEIETMNEINRQNLINMYGLSILMGIMQILALVVYVVYTPVSGEEINMLRLFTASSSIVLCGIAFTASFVCRRNSLFYSRHERPMKVLAFLFFILLLLWGMFSSAQQYERGDQIVTFFTVILLEVMFIKLRPVYSIILIMSSFTLFFIIVNVFVKPGQIGPYTYFALAFISCIAAMMNFHHTVKYIQEKHKADDLNRSLNVVASQDSLTGLANRYALNRTIPSYIGKEICVAMGDLNRFKGVNDTYGHHTGDLLLKQFAEILTEEFPKESVFRYGGDEFLIAFRCDDFEYFMQKIESVNIDFANNCDIGREVKTGCSFGCVMGTPKTMTEFFEMIKRADKELYAQKKALNVQRV